jgi:hypothetical protein
MPSNARSLCVGVLLVALLPGCSSSPPPQHPAPPPQGSGIPVPSNAGFTSVQAGAADSVGPASGSPDALYRYRFRQTEPGSDTFTFLDRDLSFYFKPAPDALHCQIENRQSRPIWIDWDHSVFHDPLGSDGKVAHGTTQYRDRLSPQAQTQIAGLQRYGDYLLPMDYLLDPSGRDEQLHRPLLPEDSSAPQFADREFGVDLVFMIDDRPRTYTFRFKVLSVLPR